MTIFTPEAIDDATAAFDACTSTSPHAKMRAAIAAADAAMEAAGWVRVRAPVPEHLCPGHVGVPGNMKVCARCGVHVDDLRPPPEPAP